MEPNGHDYATAMQAAQQRVAAACMKLPMDPAAAGISGFVNSMLAHARIDAVVELMRTPPNATWTFQDALDAAIARECHKRAEQLEEQAREATRKIQVANQLPDIIRPS